VQVLALVISVVCALFLISAAVLMFLASSDHGIAWLRRFHRRRNRLRGDRFGDLTGTGVVAVGDELPAGTEEQPPCASARPAMPCARGAVRDAGTGTRDDLRQRRGQGPDPLLGHERGDR
jgi:hypothetical protein